MIGLNLVLLAGDRPVGAVDAAYQVAAYLCLASRSLPRPAAASEAGKLWPIGSEFVSLGVREGPSRSLSDPEKPASKRRARPQWLESAEVLDPKRETPREIAPR
jgi:hypothetical protein